MLKQKLQADSDAALKAGEKEKLSVIRTILSDIKNKEIDKHDDLTDDEIISIFQSQIKKLQESVELFKKGDRMDLVADYEGQVAIMKDYFPAEISDEELEAALKQLYEKHKDTLAHPNALIGIAVKELAGKASGGRISTMMSKIM